MRLRDEGPRKERAGRGWRRNFHWLWAGESVSLFGTEVSRLALPLTAVVTLRASPAQLGVLGAVAYAPFLLLGLPAGVFVDRHRRRPVLIAADLGQLAAVGTVPLLAALGGLTLPLLVVSAFAAGGFGVFFELAYRAYLPSVVPLDALTAANGRLTASESAAEIGGPGLGGVLVQTFGAPYALLVDAASYLASAVGLGGIRQREPPPVRDPAPVRSQIGEGLSVTFRNPYLRAFAGEAASYNLCWQTVQTVLVLFAIRQLRLSPGILGACLAVGGIGALLGAVLAAPSARRLTLGRTVIAAAVVGDAAPLLLAFLQPGPLAVPLLAASLFIRGVGVTGCNVHVNAIRQTITPSQLLGRTNAAYRLLVYGVIPLGALAGGWFGTILGLRVTLAIGTTGLLGTSLFLICSPLRQTRQLSDCPTISTHGGTPVGKDEPNPGGS